MNEKYRWSFLAHSVGCFHVVPKYRQYHGQYVTLFQSARSQCPHDVPTRRDGQMNRTVFFFKKPR